MENKSILVTGGLGFIGSHFVELLYKRCNNCIIDIVDIKDYCVSKRTEDLLFDKGRESGNDVSIIYDNIETWTLDVEYDYIVNFAAQSHVDNSISNPKSFIDSNIVGFENLLRTSLESDVEEVVHISTDEVYGSLNKDFANENFLLNPSSPYSATKASADLIASAFKNTYGLNIKIIRPANNYGKFQQAEKLIPFSVISLLKNSKIEIYGDGKNIRHWLHVDDTIEAIKHVEKFGEPGEVYNIGSGEYLTNNTVVNHITDCLNLDFKNNIIYVEDRPGHDYRYAVDLTKIKNIGWKPKRFFKDEISNIVDWYKSNGDWWKESYLETLKKRASRMGLG